VGQSVVQLLTKTSFASFILVSAQAAGAITLTYTPTGATYVPVGAGNTRPLQLAATGNAISNPRNFIYQGLSGDRPTIAGDWTPVNQAGSSDSLLGAKEQRFDYLFPNASEKSPPNNTWTDNVTTQFGSFYLAGPCDFCGLANAVLPLQTTNSSANYFGTPVSGAPAGSTGKQNYLTSKVYDIVFGASGIKGTINFDALTTIIDASEIQEVQQTNGGKIVININQPSTPVPSTIPLLGAGAAFGFSRRLRCRIKSKHI
jgi:hypothetical protein